MHRRGFSSAGSAAGARASGRGARTILWGGLICGTLDIGAAFVFAGRRHVGPIRVLQGIAEALLGPASQRGGTPTALLGLLMHFGVALGWTAVFYGLSRRLPILVRRPVPSGLIYGAVVYLVMYRGVIPLTIALNSLYLTEFDRALPPLGIRGLAIHLLCVGLPIALTVRARSLPAD